MSSCINFKFSDLINSMIQQKLLKRKTEKMKTITILDFARHNYPHISNDCFEILAEACKTAELIDAPAWMPFCKYVSLSPNSSMIGLETSSIAPITQENSYLLISDYLTRENDIKKELPYLTRWFKKGTVLQIPTKSITVILYNREQLKTEGVEIKEDFGLVAVNCEPTLFVSPMTPATIERNALGIEFGGNGVPIDRNYYAKAVEFWSKWAIVK